MEATELPLPTKTVYSKQYWSAGGIWEIYASIKTLKDTLIVICTTFPFNLPIWLTDLFGQQVTDRSWKKTVDYLKHQVLTSIAAVVPDMVLCWSKSIQLLAPGVQLLIWLIISISLLSLYLLVKTNRSGFLSVHSAHNRPSLSYLRRYINSPALYCNIICKDLH